MPSCPLCENQQPAGDACDVCGVPFAAAERRPLPIAPLPDLEVTRFEPAPDSLDRLAGLEPTAAAPVPAAAAAPGTIEGLEATSHGAVGAAELDPFDLLELEPTAAAPLVEEPTPRGPLACRYCGTPSSGWEKLCLRCGMRLPVLRPVPRARGAASGERRCGDCGARTAGPRCPGCGARQPPP